MYGIARHSTIRMIRDTMREVGGSPDYYDWDAHAEGFELPNRDLIGLVGFACTENDRFHDLVFGIGIMVIDDPNLIRATDYVDVFYRRLGALRTFAMFNPDGTPTGFEAVCFDGTSASPMSRVDYRPTVDIQVTARVTQAGQWPPR